jgi:hypothetical protein
MARQLWQTALGGSALLVSVLAFAGCGAGPSPEDLPNAPVPKLDPNATVLKPKGQCRNCYCEDSWRCFDLDTGEPVSNDGPGTDVTDVGVTPGGGSADCDDIADPTDQRACCEDAWRGGTPSGVCTTNCDQYRAYDTGTWEECCDDAAKFGVNATGCGA